MSASEQSAVNSPVAVEAGVASPVAPVVVPSPFVPVSPSTGTQDVEMENSDQNDVDSEVLVNINVEATTATLKKSAEEDLVRKKNNYFISLGHYLKYSEQDPTSDAAKHAFEVTKRDEQLMKDAEHVLKMLKSLDGSASGSPLDSSSLEKKSMLVPANLPFLQLTSDVVIKSSKDTFDSVYDFCQEFVTVLEAHSLSLDDSWERLLPMCLNREERSWFEDKLKNKKFSWKKAEGILLDHFDTPFRKFLNMGRVWQMKQGKGESARAFGARFQQARRQACLEDGVQLVLCFWWNLRSEVRETCLVPLSANYGTKLPTKVEDIIALVSAATSDSANLLKNPGDMKSVAGWQSFASGGAGSSSSSSGDKKGKKRSFAGDDASKSKKSWNFQKAVKKNLCFACRAPWSAGHTCPEREKREQERVSRMAVRSGAEAGSASGFESGAGASIWAHDVNTSALANMALDCKYNQKDVVIKRDFREVSTNIVFPILVNNSIRTYSLLDCGATFSSVDMNFCLKNKIHISYIEHVKKDFVNKSNFHKFFIRLADSKSYVKRIGTCTLSVTCNNKTIKREFEVMNLTNSNEYDLSIGTDFMSSLGIGIFGLPMMYDDQDSNDERLEADRRFNNRSDLLEFHPKRE
ncbi:hypothetical protein EDC96DRAFT_593598 [Choanephora cucurbitarum]|nr:hypothetical protein EDC96DRAFT_593598 [Choanephora cucurbitarum]